MAELIARRYELIKCLGHGGMADVYLALDTILNRQVAIKVLKADMSSDPVSLERFSREANACTKLSHPNIVDIYDVGVDGNRHYIVMEYVKGYTLKQLLSRRGAIPPREAIWMTKQLAGALMEAHRNGLIHRDVKSQNVLIKDDGTVKLADFGIAVLNNSYQLTSKDSVLGSVHYLAPELAKGGSASMQSDIYSLGIVLFELLTGNVPFKGDTPIQIALMHIKNPLPDVRKFNPSIPQSIINILLKSTSKDPNNRYENIALMLRDLNHCLDENNLNAEPIKINNENSNFKEFNIPYGSENKVKDAKKNKVESSVSKLLIVCISLISILAIFVILALTGVFSGSSSKLVKVPEIEGLTLASATDALDASGLLVDYPVDRVLTEDTDAGVVIDVNPDIGSSIEKGSKVKLTVSDGCYSIMDDYVNSNIDVVKSKLNGKLFIIKVNSIDDNDKAPGTIIKQSGLLPGDKYDPNISQTVVFDVTYPTTMNIPTQILGRKVDEAYEILSEMGFNVETDLIDKDELSDSDLNRYKENEVCKIDPEEGSLYTKSDDSIVVLYYYE